MSARTSEMATAQCQSRPPPSSRSPAARSAVPPCTSHASIRASLSIQPVGNVRGRHPLIRHAPPARRSVCIASSNRSAGTRTLMLGGAIAGLAHDVRRFHPATPLPGHRFHLPHHAVNLAHLQADPRLPQSTAARSAAATNSIRRRRRYPPGPGAPAGPLAAVSAFRCHCRHQLRRRRRGHGRRRLRRTAADSFITRPALAAWGAAVAGRRGRGLALAPRTPLS